MRILTIDLEEWFHLLEFDEVEDHATWKNYSSRIERNTEFLLAVLRQHEQKATFFVLGWIAQQYPHVIKSILSEGHELGLHSYYHHLIHQQIPETFKEDLYRNMSVLEDLSGQKLTCFRAPGFSLTQNTKWAVPVLAELGIETDSSVFPTHRSHGGFSRFPSTYPCRISYNGVQIKELPVNVFSFGKLRIAFSGGGYFRFLPYEIIKVFSRRSKYIMAYFHPRDFDTGQPVFTNLSAYRKFKSYYGIRSAAIKFQKWIQEFDFVDVRTAYHIIDWEQTKVIKFH